MYKKNIIDSKVIFYTIISIIFIYPLSTNVKLFLPIDQLIFMFLSCFLLAIRVLNKRFNGNDLIFLLLVFIYCFLKKSIYPIHLMSIIGAKELFLKKEELNYLISKSKIFYIAFVFIIFYSIINFSSTNRPISTGVFDPNLSGFSILMLGIISIKNNKKFGLVILVLGVLTFSRSYLLGISILLLLYLVRNKNIMNKIFIINKNFFIVLLISSFLLIFVGLFFEKLYDLGKIGTYNSGFFRLFSFIDFSNYFRFTVNNNLIKIYYNNPNHFLLGIDLNSFYELSKTFTVDLGRPFREIKPHNFVFSYLQIFGLFALPIFVYISKVISLFVNKKNISIYIVIISYILFLGVGVTSYWLYLSVFALMAYTD